MKRISMKKWLGKLLAGMMFTAVIVGRVPVTVLASDILYVQDDQIFENEDEIVSGEDVTDIKPETDVLFDKEETDDFLPEENAVSEKRKSASVKKAVEEEIPEISAEMISSSIKELESLSANDVHDNEKSDQYFYALMDKDKMTPEDLSAAEEYLGNIKGLTVLEVDTSTFSYAPALYSLLKADAEERGGTVEGIQIFGTPGAVPAFEVAYRVQTPNGIDDGGTLKTDLFYGNFKNDASDIGSSYSVYDHFKDGKKVTLTPEWPVVRLPLKKGQYAEYFGKYNDFVLQTKDARLPLVNFSNPIFRQVAHSDDMSAFLDRARDEFKILDKGDYRLYGNLVGQYPVENSGLLGGFTADNLTEENKTGAVEFLINSHGKRNDIDKCWYEDDDEKRKSLINSETINTILSENPYYLDCWTCNTGRGMDYNLTTTALSGNCVGVFAATTIISNNGVDCRASLNAMKHSNFYWFYYNYLKSLHKGNTRAASFHKAQKAYAKALMADSKKTIKWEANYQYNLYNLFAYENFGIIEPGTFTVK